jgi:hypothetical protein
MKPTTCALIAWLLAVAASAADPVWYRIAAPEGGARQCEVSAQTPQAAFMAALREGTPAELKESVDAENRVLFSVVAFADGTRQEFFAALATCERALAQDPAKPVN